LQRLYINETSASDAGLKELAQLKNLELLDLQDTRVTDAALGALAPLKKLQWLDLDRDALTDKSLRTLREIGLLHTIGRAGEEGHKDPAADAEAVEWLDLSGCKRITRLGLKELARFTNLKHLDLSGTNLKEGDLEELAVLCSLEDLSLGRSS